MKCIPATQLDQTTLDEFLSCNGQIKRESLVEKGYVVEWQDRIIGCFELELVDHDVYWLKQLYIIQSEAAKLPVLLEYILVFAKQKKAKSIYAHSEQPVTDLLLQSLRFSLETEQLDRLKEKVIRKGHWWTYQVS